MGLLLALQEKWLPGADADDPEVLGTAQFLEEQYWRRMKAAVQNAIADAFNGRG